MRRSASLSLFLAILSMVCGYMLSSASWVGKMGINLFYKEYAFLKTWWKGGLLIYFVLMVLYALQAAAQKHLPAKTAITIHISCIATALIGLYMSYDDFRHTLSHRWMGERFHIGVYLFWVGWIIISFYLLLHRQNKQSLKNNVGMEV